MNGDLDTVRLKNTRAYIKGNDLKMQEFAAAVGISPAHLSHLAGKRPCQAISDGMARRFEARLGMPPGALDAGARQRSVNLSIAQRLERLERVVGVV